MQKRLNAFIWDLKRKKFKGTSAVAVETAEIMYIAVSASNGRAKQMMDSVSSIGEQLIYNSPLDLVIGNVMRRVLFIIREEYTEFESQMKVETSPFLPPSLRRTASAVVMGPNLTDSMYVDLNERMEDFGEPYNIKQPVLESIRGFIEDVQGVHAAISEKSLEYIHEHEVILTCGHSQSVLEFFRSAARKRKFSVIVARSAPSYEGRDTALELAKEGIDVTLIADAAVFAIMPRVNKVLLGVKAVLANGGLFAHTGSHCVCMAAKAHHVPVVVLSGLYKFTPLYPSDDQDTFVDFFPPDQVLPFEQVVHHGGEVLVQSPAFDYVPPDLVSLFISNQGPTMPSYIYRVLAEIYHPNDLPELSGPLKY